MPARPSSRLTPRPMRTAARPSSGFFPLPFFASFFHALAQQRWQKGALMSVTAPPETESPPEQACLVESPESSTQVRTETGGSVNATATPAQPGDAGAATPPGDMRPARPATEHVYRERTRTCADMLNRYRGYSTGRQRRLEGSLFIHAEARKDSRQTALHEEIGGCRGREREGGVFLPPCSKGSIEMKQSTGRQSRHRD